MQYTLSRSRRRRTIGITIKHGTVRVAAPFGVSESEINAFISLKSAWIARHQSAQHSQLQALQPRQWQHGELVYWLGQPLHLQVRPGQRNTIETIDKTLAIRLSRRAHDPSARVRRLVVDWFKQQGQLWLNSELPLLMQHHGLLAKSWRVANYTAKWGACTHAGALSFSWRLFTAPEWIIRYVVIHELCHLIHFNHSADFWALVEQHDPNYRDAERWLKSHGHTILNDQIFSYVNTALTSGQNT
ncbi:MAG: M48 family metallopeptidase [Idiomarina sp.]|nr:M48 family metallopeptidase [Idiomarina sp.]